MSNRNARLCPAIVLLLAAWTVFQERSTSFLGGTQQRVIQSCEVPCQFFKTGKLSNTVDVKRKNPRRSERIWICFAWHSLTRSRVARPSLTDDSLGVSWAKTAKPSNNTKTKLSFLVTQATGIVPTKQHIVYVNQELDNMIESTVTIPILKEKEPREFKATAETQKKAEKAAALIACRELEADLIAMRDARKSKLFNTPPSSDGTPKSRLRQLVSHAFGHKPRRGDIIYKCQEIDDVIECTVTLPVVKDMEATEFKGSAHMTEGETEAAYAAALVAFQELEPRLMAKAKARMAQQEANST